MSIKLPKANTGFNLLTDANLSVFAQAIKIGLTASVGIFPSPPVSPTALQVLIDAYNAALSLATGPGAGKVNTSAKDLAKFNLQNALRNDQQYVNGIIYTSAAGGTDYATLQTQILGTGFTLNKQPVPFGELPGPHIHKFGSFKKGQFYILVDPVPGASGYLVRILNQTTNIELPSESFPARSINILNLVSGNKYSFLIASIGANPVRNFDEQLVDQVII